MSGSVWAPWRIEYLQSLPPERGGTDGGCFLCEAGRTQRSDDAAWTRRMLLDQDDDTVVLLNRYPYANGHLLIAPRRHIASYADLEAGERASMAEFAARAESALRRACQAQGVNLGMNLGAAAGAAVPGHVHQHAVPRWHGDVNFMSNIAGVRVIPQALEAAYAALVRAW